MTTKPTIFNSEQEAEAFLNTLHAPEALSIKESTQQDNEDLIKAAHTLIVERIKKKDWTLRLSELVTAKDTAFKQNQLLKGEATDNININLKELPNKTPDELLALLESLN